MKTPDYCEGCNQRFAPIDQQSCWGCKDGDLNSSKKRARMYSREEIERIKDGLICDEVCANHHGLAYIHQLESTYSQVSKALCGKENAALDEALMAVSQLKDRLAQAERERDAAVECIEKAYKTMDRAVRKPDETIQNLREGKKIIYDYCAVKWRGVCEENSKEEQQ